MKDARDTAIWQKCYDYIAANIGLFERFTKDDLDNISPQVATGITLSTLHGCPREEIEKIAAYLITEKGLHTWIKCNPTLLGYDTARGLLDKMGYHYVAFDDHHFTNDIQFDDAVAMLARLKKTAGERGLDFGVKLTNTFPVQIRRNELPGNEMYMSGRSLFPLSINVAQKLTNTFDGSLSISYSGGADYFNLKAILETGIRPVTLATAILKPGGYERLFQLAEIAQVTLAAQQTLPAAVINVQALNALAESLPELPRYRKDYRQAGSRKPVSYSSQPIPLFDCSTAPCRSNGCPIHQDIPAYLAAVAEERYDEAFRIIARDNTAPSITGTLCDHQCQHTCTRVDYEDSVRIRQAKHIAAENAQQAFIDSLCTPEIKTKKTAAIIGAGPAGIAAAVFLRRNGVRVTVYEKRKKPFGMVQYVIPSFRIAGEAISRDFQIAEKLGVEFIFNASENYSLTELQKTHDYIIIATGAWKEAAPIHHSPFYIDALRFLEDSKKSGCCLELGKRVAVIGGGDVAMDCARAAQRNKGVEKAAIIYRRTREFMPAQHEEQELALADGVEISELLAPVSFADGVLQCEIMTLGDYDSSGRRSIEGTGEKQELHFDTIIVATGAGVDTGHFASNDIALNDRGFPSVNAACESSIPNVYIAGDCKTGPATVVKAIADGKAAAADILGKLSIEADFSAISSRNSDSSVDKNIAKKGIISESKPDSADAFRCLSCDTVCEICVDVCPNRANVQVEVKAGSKGLSPGSRQIIHIDHQCNECGNCATFCPHTGKPYKDKLTVFSGEEDFTDSENPGFYKTGKETYTIRLEDKSVLNWRKGETLPDTWLDMIETIEAQYEYLLPEGESPCC
jgi:putative selenate reductase